MKYFQNLDKFLLKSFLYFHKNFFNYINYIYFIKFFSEIFLYLPSKFSQNVRKIFP